jgi:hypothetical protein
LIFNDGHKLSDSLRSLTAQPFGMKLSLSPEDEQSNYNLMTQQQKS